jgi:hypothetical protein
MAGCPSATNFEAGGRDEEPRGERMKKKKKEMNKKKKKKKWF